MLVAMTTKRLKLQNLYKSLQTFSSEITEPIFILCRLNVPLIALFQNPKDGRLPLTILVAMATKNLQLGKK